MRLNLFHYGVSTFVAMATIVSLSAGRDLRPSDHGLVYQGHASAPTQKGDAQQMLSFFGSTTTESSVPFPEAQNISDDTWSSGGGIRREHVRMGLLVASAVFGMAGIVLLIVSGMFFVVRLRNRRQKAEAERLSSNSELHAPNDK
ncbi:uncharacterized protein LOC105167259 [Sesamum indicum]|uniref:Uncharacterized protein LOC105167259 n=1 Tax=Sesamum indicum TaxID=4182 RepID=A0A6I9TI20_SESIN|nr:uncharacterized protein LOC105167259 [Sesamum indicum]